MGLRPRTFIIIIVVFFLLLIAGTVGFMALTNSGPFADGDSDTTNPDGVVVDGSVPNEPTPTATPTIRFVEVVVAQKRIGIGQKITQDMVTIQMRPDTNIAVQAGVTHQAIEDVIDRISKTEIAPGQEVIRPMIALSPTDLASFGSDLSLYVDRGEVSVAFPITTRSGVAYAMRPGDFIDLLMSVNLIQLDSQFETALPNMVRGINQESLATDNTIQFTTLYPEGRFEVIPVLNAVQEVVPSSSARIGDVGLAGLVTFGADLQLPRQVTQLTIQQAKVLWVGTWNDPRLDIANDADITFDFASVGPDGAPVVVEATPDPAAVATPDPNEDPNAIIPTVAPKPTKERPEDEPDLVILSMTPQEALLLKWAMDYGIGIDLVLRSQGDFQTFFTTSVSLPQMVEQGGLTIPEYYEFDGALWDLEQRIEEVPTPGVPSARPPQN